MTLEQSRYSIGTVVTPEQSKYLIRNVVTIVGSYQKLCPCTNRTAKCCKPTITKICPRIISLKFQILTYLAEVMVNGTNVAGLKGTPGPVPASLPNVTGTPPRGYKQVQTWKKLQKVPLGSIPYFTMRNLP